MKDPTDLAKSIVMDIVESGFKLWKSTEFRKLVNFDELSQTEQDRIFNEIEITGIGLFVLYLDHAINIIQITEHQAYLSNLQKAAVDVYPDQLAELGSEKKFVKLWRKLIDMRLEEYRQDYQTVLEQSSNWREFKGDIRLRKMWAQVETLAIDGLYHLRRGKTKTDDPLWRFLRMWLVSVYKEITRQKYAIA